MLQVTLSKITIFFAIVIVGLYLIRLYQSRPTFKEGDFVRITGQVSEDPKLYSTRQRLTVGGLRIFVERFPEFAYGDRIIAQGEAKKVREGWFAAHSPGGVWYLDKARVEKVSLSAKASVGKQTLFSLREKVLALFRGYLPEPHNSLLAGIVLGTNSGFEKGFYEQLRTTGTLHIVVASGTNISLFAGTFLKILSIFIGRKRALVPALVGIWVYTFLVGFQPPIVRAGVMGSIAFAGLAFGREFDAWRALLISAVFLLIFNPLWLFDLGFQLSFAATAGILAFGGTFSNLFSRLPEFLKQSLSTTFSAQIAVSPIILFSFGTLQLISPLVNALVLWTVPFIMAGGFFTAAAGVAFEPLGQVLAWFVWLLLEYFVRIIQLFS